MKKILSILAVGTLMTSPLVNISNHAQNSNQSLEPSLEENGNNSLYSYNSTYSDIHKSFSGVKSEQANAKISSVGGDDRDEKEVSTTIDLADYGLNKESVKNGFDSFNLDFTWWYWMNNFSEVKIEISYHFTWNDLGNTYYQVAKATRPSGIADRNAAYLKTKASWINDTKIQLTGFVRVEARGNFGTYYETTSSVQIESVNFNSRNA